MTAPLVTLDEIKTYLGKTGTDDDLLIASVASNASAMAEADTGRTFAVTSNVTTYYSTEGQAAVVIHDRPMVDPSRVITLGGATLSEVQDQAMVWLLPDRSAPDTSHYCQLRPFTIEWFVHSFNWFDANMDSPRYRQQGIPNNLKIVGVVGFPVIPGDVKQAVLELAAWLYWRAKGGVSGLAQTLTGTEVDLTLLPMAYQLMVRNWKIQTAVVAV